MNTIRSIALPSHSRECRIPVWQSVRVPLLAGPLRGMCWLPFSGGKLPRLIMGRYEPDQTAQFLNYLRTGDVLYDVGAAVGYYTLLAARLTGPSGRVVAFEPAGKNAAFLRKHVHINRLRAVQVVQSAVGNRTGLASFATGTGTGTGHLSENGATRVGICRLDEFIQRHPVPTHIKIDVEGAELEVLEGASSLLATSRPTLFLSTHGPALRRACCQYLANFDYHIRSVSIDPNNESELLCSATATVSSGADSSRIRSAA